MKFQMFRLGLEKTEEPEINLPTSTGSLKKQESSKKTSTLLIMPNLWLYYFHNKLWKILQEMGIPDHLTCLLRNLYAAQDARVRIVHGTTDWFQIGKAVRQGCILSPGLFNFMQGTSCEIPGWMKHKLKSRLPGEISVTSDTQMTPPLWQKGKQN